MLDPNDKYQWLENIDAADALAWVNSCNAATSSELSADSRFSAFQARSFELLSADDRAAFGSFDGEYVYNFWQDKQNARGIFRRTTLESYKSKSTDWDVILDVDALAAEEDENWIFQECVFLTPCRSRALLMLSRGGKDASVIREFDVESRSFVNDGFCVEEAKHNVAWLGKDMVLIGSDFGPDSLTDSGYPRSVRLWLRGQKPEAAATLFEGERSDMSTAGLVLRHGEHRYAFVDRKPTIFETELHVLDDELRPLCLPLPHRIQVFGLFEQQLILRLDASFLSGDGESHAAGSLIGFDLDQFRQTGEVVVESLFEPDAGTSIAACTVSKRRIYVSILDNVSSCLIELVPDAGAMRSTEIDFHGRGSISIASSNSRNDVVFVSYTDFLTPPSQYCIMDGVLEPQPMLSAPAQFNADDYEFDQYWATSRDGTKVPYYLIHKRGLVFSGDTPTLQFGYGGFEISLLPAYISPLAIQWLQEGSAYVIANIRGGGEFGKSWHESAQKKNKQRSYDDFIAVSEDLIERGVSNPENLGIMGGSNGGLLMGAMLTQRPDLYGAIVCQVPLLDMRRYHRLLAGASWMAEYGDPDNPEEWSYISEYSPYQNLSAGTEYPKTFFTTSTKDDRVHPGHARKMVAKMNEQGHETLYFENIEGGHGGAANFQQAADIYAMVLVYLQQQIGPRDE